MYAHHFKEIRENTCACLGGAETTAHFLLVCPFFTVQRNELIGIVSGMLKNFTDLTTNNKVEILLYGYFSLKKSQNCDILNATMNYMTKTMQFCYKVSNLRDYPIKNFLLRIKLDCVLTDYATKQNTFNSVFLFS